jgi:uncharacterized protein (TIGR02246 family)
MNAHAMIDSGAGRELESMRGLSPRRAEDMSETAQVVAQSFVRAINRQYADGLAALMTEEHRFIDSLGALVSGRETMRAGWRSYFRMVPDYTIDVDEMLSDGPVVVMLGLAQGSYAPDGQTKPENRWTTPAVFRAFIEEGKVAEWRVYADNEPIRRLMAKTG